jgi:hypothetical protein
MKTIIVFAAGALLLAPVATLARADSEPRYDRKNDHASWIKYDEGRSQPQQLTPAERAAASLGVESKKLRDIKED